MTDRTKPLPQVLRKAETNIFLAHYTQPEVIAAYLSNSPNPGIAYVVKNIYGQIYREIIQTIVSQRPKHCGFRILEYGCGGGINLREIIKLFHAQGAHLANAIGTDFSPPMIEAARSEAEQHLPVEPNTIVSYFVGRHETLTQDLASGLGVLPGDLHNTFDLILGVNTFRYAYRLKTDDACARDLFALLRPGGYSIMIDMNRGFRCFVGSRIHDLCTRAKQRSYIPSLRQYSRPFQRAGFAITQARSFFCFTRLPFGAWIPDRMEASLLALCRSFTPILNTYVSPFAKHSLVIAKKPCTVEH